MIQAVSFTPTLQERKILILAGAPALASRLERMLLNTGALVHCCSDLLTGVRICEAGEPDVALVSLDLPGHSALVALERIKRLPHPPPVILLGTPASRREECYAVALGADATITPEPEQRLLSLISAFCGETTMTWDN